MQLEATEIPPDVEQTDEEEAPYGYFKNGKPRKTPPSGGGLRSMGGKSLSSLRDPLADRIVEYLGPPLAMVSPLSVAVLDERSEKTADALIALATRRPRVRKMIERFVEGSATADLGATVVGIGTAIQVDRGAIEADSKLGRYFHLDQHYRETYNEEPPMKPAPEANGLLQEIG